MISRYDFLSACQKLIKPLVDAVANHDIPKIETTTNQLNKLYKQAIEQVENKKAGHSLAFVGAWLTKEIHGEVWREIFFSVYKSGTHTKAWLSMWQYGIRTAIESVDIGRIEAIVKTLKDCINEFNKNHKRYFFMDKEFSLSEFLEGSLDDGPGNSAIVMAARASASISTNKDNQNTKKFADIISYFMKQGANLNKKPILQESSVSLVPFLLKMGANPNDNYPIVMFLSFHSLDTIKQLIDYKAEYKQLPESSILTMSVKMLPNKYGVQPNTIVNTIQFLINLDPTLLLLEDKFNNIPLTEAVTSGMTSTLKLLLKEHKERNLPISDTVKRACMFKILFNLIDKENKSRHRYLGYETYEEEKARIKENFKLLLVHWGAAVFREVLTEKECAFHFNSEDLKTIHQIIRETELEGLKNPTPVSLDTFTLWRPADQNDKCQVTSLNIERKV